MTERAVEAGRSAHNIPAPLTPLIGREHETAALLALLRDSTRRLVTLSGAGGVGKTRLALAAAQALLPISPASPFAHGVYLVSLAALAPREALDAAFATTIASALGIVLSGPDSALTQVHNYLREKSMLLLLDNLEHLLAGAPLLASLLEAAPGLTILATSRERLQLRGEHVLELDGLACPPPQAEHPLAEYAAVQLFVQAARSHAPALALDAETALPIMQICRLVGGLPLGLELAASWTQLLSCAEIAQEIAQSMDFLTGSTPDLPERQRSMRAIFDSSWNLLSPSEQQALAQLAVFQGSFTREAAQQVAEMPLPLLASLVNKSLLRRVAQSSTVPRYAVPEPLRQYAAERLAASGQAEAARARHASYYLGLLEAGCAALRGPEQPAALARLSAEIDQLRAAWRTAIAAGASAALGTAADALFHLYDMRSWFAEGAALFGAAQRSLAAHADDDTALVWAKLLAREGWFRFHGGNPRQARQLLEQSISLLRAHPASSDLVFSLNYLAAVCSYLGEYAASEALCGESLALTAASGDLYGRVVALSVLSQAAYERGDYLDAQEWGEQSLALEQRIGSPWSIAFSLTNLGKVAAALGRHEAAQQLLAESYRIRQELGDIRGMALCLNRLGAARAAQDDAAQALAHYRRSLALFREIGNQWGVAGTLLNLGRLALDMLALAAAARLLHTALSLALETGVLPQIAAIVASCEHLARRSGETAWAAELAQLASAAHDTLDSNRANLTRLSAWLELHAAAAPTIEQALAALDLALMPSPPPAPRPAAGFPAGLTAREVEVLRLVATGLTDAQVAEQLVLSRRTVHAHLASIYGKLQVNTRSAATRFALEHGLA